MALPAILALGLVLRAYWVVHYGQGLEGNGCEYARIAENLFKRGTYIGLFEGPELMFPPVYPMLLAIGAFLVGSVDRALWLVPFSAGVVLVPVAFALGRLVYGARVGLTFAAITALHPLLVDLSSTAYSESVYLPLMLGGLYWGLRSLRSGQPTPSVISGTMFGLSVLTRPEAFLCIFAVLGAGLLWGLPGPSRARSFARFALWTMIPFVGLVGPYAAYLSLHTGGLRLEGKGLMNYTIAERRNTGMSPSEAGLGIGPDLSEQGPLLSPNHFVLTTHRHLSIREIVSTWIASARRNEAALRETLISLAFGSFLAPGLMAVALFSRPWSQWRAVDESVLLAVVVGDLFILLSLPVILTRYALPLLVIALLWVAKGIDDVARWSVGTTRRTLARLESTGPRVGIAIRCFLIALLPLLAVREVRWDPLQARVPDSTLYKDVGAWLARYQPGPKRVMTVHPEVAYHAGGTYLPLPYAAASLGLQYVRQKQPDFIVLIGEDHPIAPYLGQWLERGIPDDGARLIHEAVTPGAVAIYEWHAGKGGPR